MYRTASQKNCVSAYCINLALLAKIIRYKNAEVKIEFNSSY